MTDFSFTTYLSRDEVADELRGDPEHLAYVLGRIGAESPLNDIVDFADCLEAGADRAAIAMFYRAFANAVEAA